MPNIYREGLDKNNANYTPLTPLTFLARTAYVYPDRTAVIHGQRRYTWLETFTRARRLASALVDHGIGEGDTVAVMLNNTPEMIECHFGVPVTGAVLNTLNTRLDAETIAFMLEHGEAKVLITDREYSPTVRKALWLPCSAEILVIDVDDPEYGGPGERWVRGVRGVHRLRQPRLSRGVVRPTNGMRSRSITPREPPATRRAWSITIAAPTSTR
jgi:fatty-acyl-CoA synthase